jgi:hypothetical protein
MGTAYATIDDILSMKRSLTPDEQQRAEALIPVVCASLRFEAAKRNRDLDVMITASADLAEVAKSVTVDVVMRELMTSTTQEPMTQYSQSALGYSVSGTFLIPGGGLFIKKAELARLGLLRQRYGVIDLYDSGNNS